MQRQFELRAMRLKVLVLTSCLLAVQLLGSVHFVSAQDASDVETTGKPADIQQELKQIASSMNQIQGRLGNGDTSEATQKQQFSIIQHLDRLLAMQPQSSSQTSPKNGGVSATEGDGSSQSPGDADEGSNNGSSGQGSGNRPGTNGEGRANGEDEPLIDRNMADQVWGHLPARFREQLHASVTEQFLPQYEHLIEKYYNRLAELEGRRQ